MNGAPVYISILVNENPFHLKRVFISWRYVEM